MQQEYIYHSFPRVRPHSNIEEQIYSGLKILQSMKDIGLLLYQDHWVFDQLFDDGTTKPISVSQNIFCGTCIPLSDLPEHSNIFGLFSLEFEIRDFIFIGGHPVFYAVSSMPGVGSMFAELMSGLYSMEKFFKRGQELFDYAEQHKTESINLTKNNVPVYNLSQEDIEKLKNLYKWQIEEPYYNFNSYEATLKALSQFFIPVGKSNEETYRQLKYYRQNEWRLIGDLIKDGKPVCNHLTETEKQYVTENFPVLSNLNVPTADNGIKKPFIDVVKVLKTFKGKHILEYVNKIYVPESTRLLVINLVSSHLSEDRIISIQSL